MQKLTLNTIKARLNEAADPLKDVKNTNMKTPKATAAKSPSSSYDKAKPLSKGKPATVKKMAVNQKAKNSGPEKAPETKKIPANNKANAPKEQSAKGLNPAGKGSSTTPLANADSYTMDFSNLGVSWAKTRELSQHEKHDLEGTGIMSDKLGKIKFSVSMPKVDYGIVPTGKQMPVSQSHKWSNVSNVKIMKEGLVNGQVVIRMPNKVYNFDVMSAKDLKAIVENYNKIGQELEVVFKPMCRKFYLQPEIKKALAEAVHYNMNGLKSSYDEKLLESKKAVKKALTESHNEFFASTKEEFVTESFSTVMKQGYQFYKALYESALKPYDVVVRAKTSLGNERFVIVTRALSEGHAAFNAFNEVIAETGVDTKLDTAFVGAKKFVYEDVQGILSKSLKFDIDTKDFGKAGPSTKKTTTLNPKAPSVDKVKVTGKPTTKNVDKMPTLGKGGDKTSLGSGSLDKRAKTVKDFRPKPPADKGIRWPDQ